MMKWYGKGFVATVALLCTVAVPAVWWGHVSAVRQHNHSIVEEAMSGHQGSNLYMDQVVRLGEPLLPLIFDEMRAHPDSQRLYLGGVILAGMVQEGTVNPSAPYLRMVMADIKEPVEIRLAAIDMLSWYWDSREVRMALAERIEEDPMPSVRVACIAILGTLTSTRGGRTGDWGLDRVTAQAFSLAAASHDSATRTQACRSLGCVAAAAKHSNADLNWCKRLLLMCTEDADKNVRKAAADALSYGGWSSKSMH